MSRKDYEDIAATLRSCPEGSTLTKAEVVEMFVAFFARDNGRFDRDRFRAASVAINPVVHRIANADGDHFVAGISRDGEARGVDCCNHDHRSRDAAQRCANALAESARYREVRNG